MAGEAIYYGTGRRKNAVARVRIVPGTGKVTINGRDGKEYFGREALLNYATTPFKVTDTVDQFDVLARCNGGGISGQAGALRHGISRALLEAGDYRAELKKAGYLTRDSRMVGCLSHCGAAAPVRAGCAGCGGFMNACAPSSPEQNADYRADRFCGGICCPWQCQLSICCYMQNRNKRYDLRKHGIGIMNTPV